MTGVAEQTTVASGGLAADLVAADTELAVARRELAAVEERVRRRDPAADAAVLRHAMLRVEGAEQGRERAQAAVDARTVADLLGEAEVRGPVFEAEIARARQEARESATDLARRVEARNGWARDLLAGLRDAGWSPRPAVPRSVMYPDVGPPEVSVAALVVSTREVLREVVDAAAEAAGVAADRRR